MESWEPNVESGAKERWGAFEGAGQQNTGTTV